MGLAWRQGPLAQGAIGHFLVPDPLPERLLYAEPLRRRMRVKFGGAWIADSQDVVLLHEPGRYPVAYFPLGGVAMLHRLAASHSDRDIWWLYGARGQPHRPLVIVGRRSPRQSPTTARCARPPWPNAGPAPGPRMPDSRSNATADEHRPGLIAI
jgi:Domain of unknown function (DUF427)